MYQSFIGIDISKNDFVVALHRDKNVQTFSNNVSGFKAFYAAYRSVLPDGLVVLETTGGYELALIHYLKAKRCSVHRANTRKVKYFIRSLGRLAKSDAIDAKSLAEYGAERYEKLALFCENPRKKLQKFVQRREDLKQVLVQEKNRRQAPDQADMKTSINALVNFLEKEIKRLEQQMEAMVNADPLFMQQCQVLQTVHGIGKIIAVQLLALLPEIGQLDRKKIASLAGVAPHPYESGQKIGYRFTKGGRKAVKRILFMAAISACKSHSRLGNFYRQLMARGKKKMVALTALMRKMLVIANAKMRDCLLTLPDLPQHS